MASGKNRGCYDANLNRSLCLLTEKIDGTNIRMIWENTCDIAKKLGLKPVPYLGEGSALNDIRNIQR